MNNTFKVGDIVTFIGGKIYGLPNLNIAKYTKPECVCVISSIKLGDRYPYLIRAKNKNKKLQGWVSSNLIHK